MFASFICKNCGNKVIFDSSEDGVFPQKCSKCGLSISNHQYISAFFDNCSALERSVNQLEFCGLSSSDPDIVYESDLNDLNTLYYSASPSTKKLLSQILDKNLLIIFRKAQEEDVEFLQKYLNDLNSVHSRNSGPENRKLLEFLGIEED